MKVVICGAGIMGCSVAYYLSLKGVAATLVEPCGVACAASGKAAGFLVKDWFDGSALGPLVRKGYEMHAELAQILPGCDYRTLDTLSLSLEEGATCSVSVTLPAWVNGPVIKYSKKGSTENTAQVNPKKITNAMFQAASKQGATLVMGRVTGMQLNEAKDKVTGVILNEKILEADVVVIAMGPWSVHAAQWLPLPTIASTMSHSITIHPETELTPHALYTQISYENGVKGQPEFYPRLDGDVYICGVTEEGKVPDKPSEVKMDAEACRQLHRAAGIIRKEWEGIEVQVQQACYLPFSPDKLPLIGKFPGLEGAYVATGHEDWGIIAGPPTGAALAELIVDGESNIVDLAPYDPSRFK